MELGFELAQTLLLLSELARSLVSLFDARGELVSQVGCLCLREAHLLGVLAFELGLLRVELLLSLFAELALSFGQTRPQGLRLLDRFGQLALQPVLLLFVGAIERSEAPVVLLPELFFASDHRRRFLRFRRLLERGDFLFA